MGIEKRARGVVPYLRAWRLHRVMNQDELAKVAGVGRGTIFRLERPGQRANELTMHKLARALDVSVRQLQEEAPPDRAHAA